MCVAFAATMEGVDGIDHIARAVVLNPFTLLTIIEEEARDRRSAISSLRWLSELSLEGVGEILALASLFETSRSNYLPSPFVPTAHASSDRYSSIGRSRVKLHIRSILRSLQHREDIDDYVRRIYAYVDTQLMLVSGMRMDPSQLFNEVQLALSSVSLLNAVASHNLPHMRETMADFSDELCMLSSVRSKSGIQRRSNRVTVLAYCKVYIAVATETVVMPDSGAFRCTVCLMDREHEEIDLLTIVHGCKHVFCLSCIIEWRTSSPAVSQEMASLENGRYQYALPQQLSPNLKERQNNLNRDDVKWHNFQPTTCPLCRALITGLGGVTVTTTTTTSPENECGESDQNEEASSI